jgi:nucleoside-diphosphate-sugar epimerase
MTQNVLEAAARMDAFVVNTSSRDVYGSSLVPNEDEVTTDSPNGYAASKLGAEAIVNAYRHTEDISAVSIRLANVYGSEDHNRRVIPLFIALADAGEELTVFGDGTLLDFVHVDNVCEEIHRVIRRASIVDGESLNIGSGAGTALTEVADYISDTIEACPGWTASQNRSGDINKYVSDISRANAMLEYSPSVPLHDGLEDTIEWYQDHPQLLERLVG